MKKLILLLCLLTGCAHLPQDTPDNSLLLHNLGLDFYADQLRPADFMPQPIPEPQPDSPSAQNALGYRYLTGQSVGRNYTSAAQLFWQASQSGYAPAQNNLAVMHILGLGVTQNTLTAISLLEQAAPHEAAAMDNLANLYISGYGVNADRRLAHQWYNRAALAGYAPSQYRLGIINLTGDNQDYIQAAEFFRLAAAQDYPPAQFQLGHLYLAGLGLAKDRDRALKLFEQAAKGGNQLAQYQLGMLLAASQNYSQAEKWLQAAADQGQRNAQIKLGMLYLDGHAGRINKNWYIKAAGAGHQPAQLILGTLYMRGIEVEQNLELAESWLKKPAKRGNIRAQYQLGLLYEERGKRRKAMKWFRSAAEQGYLPAKQKMLS